MMEILSEVMDAALNAQEKTDGCALEDLQFKRIPVPKNVEMVSTWEETNVMMETQSVVMDAIQHVQ